jgi:hypothetical protein
MPSLPLTEHTPLVRTHYGDDAGWAALVAAVGTPSPDDGFLAYVEIIDDPAFDDADPAGFAMDDSNGNAHALIIIADAAAQTAPEFPLLCLSTQDGWSVRVIARELWSIQNNLSLANMDAAEFVRVADEDGVFRGF